MITVTRHVAASTQAVWGVLADGWSYATWVVGASRIRDVDAGWPSAGSRIHHSVGLWPAVIDDTTSVVSSTPERELVLTARAWPVGVAKVRLVLRESTGGCEVSMTEDATSGPGRLVPAPLRQALIAPRNREALNRLALLAEGRSTQGH